MTHTVTVRATRNRQVGVFCSCSPGEDLQLPWAETMPLDELNRLADEHIESAERLSFTFPLIVSDDLEHVEHD